MYKTSISIHSAMNYHMVARTLVEDASSPGAIGTRIIYTPWPFTLGQALVTLLTIYVGTRKSSDDEKGRLGNMIDLVCYIFLLIWVFGATIWDIVDIAIGATQPKIGIVATQLSLAALSTPAKWSGACLPRCYTGYAIAAIGLIFYIVRGVLSTVHRSFKVYNCNVWVTQGCPHGVFTDWAGNHLCDAPGLYHFTGGEEVLPSLSWAVGLVFAIAAIFDLVSRRYLMKLRFKYTSSILSVFGLILMLSCATVNTHSITVDYDDCRNVQQRSDGNWTGCIASQIDFPGSISGFWTQWAQDKVAIAMAVFAW
jgi:hypothetical protein